MEVEYNLIPQDIEAFARFHLKRGPKVKPQLRARLAGVVVVLVLLGFLGAAGFFAEQPGGAWAAGCCIGVLCGFLASFLLLALCQKMLVVSNTKQIYNNQESRWFFAARRLRISADGFEFVNEFEQTRHVWDVVWLIDSTNDHVFFYTTLNQAHVIPRRAFRDEQHFEEFIDLACRYHKGQEPRASATDVILDALPADSTGITRLPGS